MTEPMRNNYHSSHLLEMVGKRLLVEDFLIEKSDINVRDENGKNALYYAIENQSMRNIKKLIKHEISLMVTTQKHALFHSVELDNLEAMVYILNDATDIDITNEVGQTLLMKALQKESMMMVRYLLNHGANLDVIDDKHNMAIDYANLCKNRDIFNLVHYRILYEELKLNTKECKCCASTHTGHDKKEF